MSADNLLREKLRVSRDLIGTAHPFFVTHLVLKKGTGILPEESLKVITMSRESPVRWYWRRWA